MTVRERKIANKKLVGLVKYVNVDKLITKCCGNCAKHNSIVEYCTEYNHMVLEGDGKDCSLFSEPKQSDVGTQKGFKPRGIIEC